MAVPQQSPIHGKLGKSRRGKDDCMRIPATTRVLISLFAALALAPIVFAQDGNLAAKLEGFDDYMAKVLKDWNGPGIGVGIVSGDKLVFAKGYGYRDYGSKLPFTPATV